MSSSWMLSHGSHMKAPSHRAERMRENNQRNRNPLPKQDSHVAPVSSRVSESLEGEETWSRSGCCAAGVGVNQLQSEQRCRW